MLFKHKNFIEKSAQSISDMTEFTLLDSRATEKDIQTLINYAVKYGYHGVCVSPDKVEMAREYIDYKVKSEMALISVVGFPLGTNSLQIKVSEAKEIFRNGGDEVDVVINISKVKEGDFNYIRSELQRIVRISRGRKVKAIIETCYLKNEEIKQVCKACVKAKVDFIQTSTGFGTGGATVEDIELILKTVQGKCEIKAAGGIRTKAQVEELIRAGATRIGTSRII